MKEKVIKTAKTVLKVVVGILLILFAVAFLSARIKGSPLFLFGKTTMWVVTDSMSPTIPARTFILVERVTAEEVKEGDIIAFYSTDPRIEGQINTHRVESVVGNTFVTKGDNNPVSDGAYSAKAENIVGRYVKTLPVMTFIGRIILSDIGFMVVAFLIMAVMAICYLPDMKKTLQKKEEQDTADKQKEIDRLVKEEIKRLIDAEKKEQSDEKK